VSSRKRKAISEYITSIYKIVLSIVFIIQLILVSLSISNKRINELILYLA
jgi:amino acid permease